MGYEDPRFNQEVDRATGYRTKSILAVPLLRRQTSASENRALAVIQMINKTEFDGAIGKFDEEDIQVMETFATFVASKLEGTSLLEKGAASGPVESEAGKAFHLSASPSNRRRDSSKHFDG